MYASDIPEKTYKSIATYTHDFSPAMMICIQLLVFWIGHVKLEKIQNLTE